MQRTYQGSCHCGAVRFECELDLAAGTSKCNCSLCTKTRFWKAIVKAEAFRLRQGADVLSTYRFGSKNLEHFFCSRCGVKTFGRGHMDDFGDFYGVSVACLDNATTVELVESPVRYEDGRHDNWGSLLTETRHL